MYELLLRSIANKVGATEEELQLCKGYFMPRKLRKRQYLLQQGDVCSRLAFVSKGALYAYSMDDKGSTRVMQFAFEGWWIADLYSFLIQEPSDLHIEALEDCEMLLVEREQHERMMRDVPAYESYIRILFQNAYVALQQRLESTLGLSAEEKYARFVEQHPAVLNRIPQQFIASYLGITPETLSRIRRQSMT